MRTLLLSTSDLAAPIPPLVYSGLGALLLLFAGLRFIQIGKLLIFLLRFESLGLFVDMRGQVSRSKVVVGAGMLDQVKSENETNRSEMLITYRGARLITEADGIMSPRLLFAMHSGDSVLSAIRELQIALERRATNGVSIAGVDTTAQSLSDMVNLNLYLKAANPPLAGHSDVTAVPPRLPSPNLPIGSLPSAAANEEQLLEQVIRLHAKAVVALKGLAKNDVGSNHESDETSFREVEALFAAAEKYQSAGKYR